MRFIPHDDTVDAVPVSPAEPTSEPKPPGQSSSRSSVPRRIVAEVRRNPAYRVAVGIAVVVVACGVVTQRAWVSLEHVTGVDKPNHIGTELPRHGVE